MSLQYISSLATLGVMVIAATPAMAESGISNSANFACLNENVTAITVNGNSKPVFHWQENLLESSGVNATELCHDVAMRLNEYVAEKNTAESANSSPIWFRGDQQLGLPTICATDHPKGGCEAVLFTLSPTEKPVQTANNLLTDILDQDLQSNKVVSQSSERGVQSISYSVSIFDLIFGSKSKYLK